MEKTIKVADKPTADSIKTTVESNAEKLDGIAQSLESGGMLADPNLGLEALKQSLDELKNYVGNGKRDVAGAITAKGIPTAADAGFATLVKNIESIVTLMQGTRDANATASQILKGYSAYVKGVKVNGGINSLGAQTITPGTAAKTIAANQYLSGVQTIAGDPNLVAANIAKGKSVFGVAGNFEGGLENFFATDIPIEKDETNKKYIIQPVTKILTFEPQWAILILRCTYNSNMASAYESGMIVNYIEYMTANSSNTLEDNCRKYSLVSNATPNINRECTMPSVHLKKSSKKITVDKVEKTYTAPVSGPSYPAYLSCSLIVQ